MGYEERINFLNDTCEIIFFFFLFFFLFVGVCQESIPSTTAEKVKEAMLEGVELALGLPKNSLKRPFYSRVQLW